MQKLFWACAFLLLNCYCFAKDCETISDEAEYFRQYTEPQELCLLVENGFQILFKIELIDTDPASANYFIIKQGESLEDDGAGIIFAHNLQTPRTFVVYSNVAFIKFEVNADSTFKGVSFSFKRIGEKRITTTENPLPQSTWPQPSANDSIYFMAYVSGYEYARYREEEIRLMFRKSVAKMAIEYTETNNFPVVKEITKANVLLSELKMCPLDLPESTTCAMITFALPIYLNETQWSGYEFKEEHLSAMWLRYGEKYLKENGFHIYDVPNVDDAVTAWGTVIAIVMLLFLILMGIGIFIHGKIMYYVKIYRRASGNIIVIDNDQRESVESLTPHRLQIFPPIFDQEVPSPGIYHDDSEGVWNKEHKRISLQKKQYDNAAFETDT